MLEVLVMAMSLTRRVSSGGYFLSTPGLAYLLIGIYISAKFCVANGQLIDQFVVSTSQSGFRATSSCRETVLSVSQCSMSIL